MTEGIFVRTVRLGVRSLLLHKLRSALTTLGVLFGVSSVVAMLAIGEGASAEAQEQIRRLGSQNVILRSVKPPEDAGRVRFDPVQLRDVVVEGPAPLIEVMDVSIENLVKHIAVTKL